jgi:hypothetical protein
VGSKSRFRVIRLGWRKSAVARAATIASGRPKISVMNFHARDQKTREVFLAISTAFAESLPAAWRASIFWIDEGDGDVCNIEFRAGAEVTREIVIGIGQAAEKWFGREVTLNRWVTLEEVVADGQFSPWSPRAQAWFAAQMRGK